MPRRTIASGASRPDGWGNAGEANRSPVPASARAATARAGLGPSGGRPRAREGAPWPRWSFGAEQCFRSFGFELQRPCSAFTSWRACKRDPKTFSLAAHNQELVFGHVTFIFQQLFQISLERGLCFNHRIERLLHLGR